MLLFCTVVHICHGKTYFSTAKLTFPRQNLRFQGKTKGLAKLGNIVAETLLRMQMFPNLAAWETCCAETNFAAWKQKMVLPGDIFASRTQSLRPKHMFASLATPGNVTRNTVSEQCSLV